MNEPPNADEDDDTRSTPPAGRRPPVRPLDEATRRRGAAGVREARAALASAVDGDAEDGTRSIVSTSAAPAPGARGRRDPAAGVRGDASERPGLDRAPEKNTMTDRAPKRRGALSDLHLGLVPAVTAPQLVEQLGGPTQARGWLADVVRCSDRAQLCHDDAGMIAISADPVAGLLPLVDALGGTEAFRAWSLELEQLLAGATELNPADDPTLVVHRTPVTSAALLIEKLGGSEAALAWVRAMIIGLARAAASEAFLGRVWVVPLQPGDAVVPLVTALGDAAAVRVWAAEVYDRVGAHCTVDGAEGEVPT